MSNGTRKPMRQGQQNRRGRGRGRKPQNPLSRNLESNGPDVKIRGTASHIAEKYTTLARDAQVSGDSVAGESYLQHAEHYNRIIMANQAQQQAASPAQGEGMNGSGRDRQGASPEGEGGTQTEAVPVAATSDNTANDKVDTDAPAKTAKTPAAKDISEGNAGDDEGLTRMMARSAKKSGNGEDKEKQAGTKPASDKKSASDDAASDDAVADDSPDEAIT
jgi:Domain of unknown function (DUF4167)